MYERALSIGDLTLAPTHPETVRRVQMHAACLVALNQHDRAALQVTNQRFQVAPHRAEAFRRPQAPRALLTLTRDQAACVNCDISSRWSMRGMGGPTSIRP